MKKLAKLKLHDVRVLSNSEMRNIKGESSHPIDWKAFGECTQKCMEDVYSQKGWTSIFAGVATYYVPYVGVAIFGTCLVACEEYGPHIHY